MTNLLYVAKQHWDSRPTLGGIATLRKNLKGSNKKFAMQDQDTDWLIKISDGWGDDPRSVNDLNEREELFCILAKANGIPVIDCWRIDTRELAFEAEVQWKKNDIRDKAVASRFVHAERCAACENGHFNESQLRDLCNVLTFCHWIGDEDRGMEDVLWLEGRPCLIDQSLSGPPSNQYIRGSRCRGTHFQRNDPDLFSPEQIIKKCPSGKPSLVAHLLRDHRVQLPIPSALGLIQRTDLSELAEVVEYYSISTRVTEQLAERLKTLDNDFRIWQNHAENLLLR